VRSEGKRTGLKIWRHSFVVTGENSSKPAERVMMADNAAPAPKKPDGS
jgi:hypothetical protein